MAKKILLSFVGTNDGGALFGKPEGAIITALRNENFDKVILLWNENKVNDTFYSNIVDHIAKVARKEKLVKEIQKQELNLLDVTDHNDIYIILKQFTDSLSKDSSFEYFAAISSGTPAMQVCWILLSESADFSEEYPLNLIKVKDPKFGKSENIKVKLATTLPKILHLKKEIESLKLDLIPPAILQITRGQLLIGDKLVDLSPIEFCYYRYFADRVLTGQGEEKFSGMSLSLRFMKIIYSFHEESFPDLDLNREELRKMIKSGSLMGIQTFRGNISKINKKLRKTIGNETLFQTFAISITGKRGAKFYGIRGDNSKIVIR